MDAGTDDGPEHFDADLVARIGGVRQALGANQTILFDDGDQVWLVDRGHLDIFVAAFDAGGVAGRRAYVGRVTAGQVAFGAPPLPDRPEPGTRFGFLAVPGLETVVWRGERSGLTDGAVDLSMVTWIDDWIWLLSETLSDGVPVPRAASLLEAESDVAYTEGAILSAQHFDVIWIRAESGRCVLLDGGAVAVEPGGPPIPLTERSWLTARSDVVVSGFYTPTLLARNGLAAALDQFHDAALVQAATAAAHRRDADRMRSTARLEAAEASAARAMWELGRTLDPQMRLPHGVADGGPGIVAACRIVGEAIGQRVRAPRAMPEGTDPEAQVRAIARASGLRARGISLPGDWWRRDGPAAIGFRLSDGGPVALLPGRRGYAIVSPDDGVRRPMDAATARDLSGTAYQFYRSLPNDVRDARGALRFSLRGLAPDLRTVVAMGVLGGLAALLTPIVTGRLLVEVIPRGDVPMWMAMLAALGMAAFGTLCFDIARAVALLRIEGRMDQTLQAAVWDRLLALPAPFFRRFTAGDLADRANGISAIRQLLTGATASAVMGAIFSLFSFALLFWYSWRLALCATGVLSLLLGATILFARGQMRHQREQFRYQGRLDGLVFQLITGLAKLRVANAEPHALERWAEHFGTQKRHAYAARLWNAGLLTMNGVFPPLASLALFAFIYYQLIDDPRGESSFGLVEFLSFNAAFGQLVAALTGLAASATAIVSVIPLFERVGPILDAEPEAAADAVDPGEISGDIEVSNLAFRYLPGTPMVVDGVSLRIRAGEYVAFVGPSGSGKSSLYRLLLGFEKPAAGAIFIDGHDLSSLDPTAVRTQMGVVLQDGRLIAGSIFENISGTQRLSTDGAWEAARAAGLDEDIRAMPMGMHTVLPEGGIGLSGGQKQRLLLARALARKPRILLLDEATSALDNRTQAIVQESLRHLTATRIVIAHRLSTIRHVDRIYVMQRGRIVQVGTYDDLMAVDGPFATLARRQLV